MSKPKSLTATSLVELIDAWYEEPHDVKRRVEGFLQAGSEGIAVYENVDLGHPNLGDKVILPFGPDNTITGYPPDCCPVELPDGRMSWRYWLHGVYVGGPLEVSA
jgi:hypothetical protein